MYNQGTASSLRAFPHTLNKNVKGKHRNLSCSGMEKQSNDSNESPQEPAADADSAAAATTGGT